MDYEETIKVMTHYRSYLWHANHNCQTKNRSVQTSRLKLVTWIKYCHATYGRTAHPTTWNKQMYMTECVRGRGNIFFLKIGLIALKDRDFCKIPPKAWAPVKYHRKVEMWTESSTLLDLSVSSVNLDRNTPDHFLTIHHMRNKHRAWSDTISTQETSTRASSYTIWTQGRCLTCIKYSLPTKTIVPVQHM